MKKGGLGKNAPLYDDSSDYNPFSSRDESSKNRTQTPSSRSRASSSNFYPNRGGSEPWSRDQSTVTYPCFSGSTPSFHLSAYSEPRVLRPTPSCSSTQRDLRRTSTIILKTKGT